ncbi:ABC transporter substrate-binding protein [Nocardioides cheoyonin]|uniref:ABC transporter substrate-binding protein n=1 Tax=Nocardioides cheoyonin TaxID=3156615 RepID=UPI0032B60580
MRRLDKLDVRRMRRRLGATLLAVPLALAALTACGSDNGSSASASGTTKITVGVIPILDVAPIYLGVDKGFFKDEGLDVKLELAQGGAAIVPAVVSGQYQFGFSNTTSLLLANTQGLPLKVVASGVNAGSHGDSFEATLVKGDSDIKRPRDLAGKRVAVNTLKNISSTTVNEMVRQDGGDPSGIQYVELAFPDMIPALNKGDVDAAAAVEPFTTMGLQSGDRSIGTNYADTADGLAVALYFTSEQYIAEHQDVVDGFTSAINKSLDYAEAHPDEVRQIATTYTDIDPKLLKKLTLPHYQTDIDRDSIQKLADLGVQDKLFSKEPDLDKLLP